MHINALDSVHASAHECTQFDAYLSVYIDAELDDTYHEVVLSICEAAILVSLSSARVNPHSKVNSRWVK